MRRLWAAALTPVLGLAFLVVGGGSANAFGGEVLGCAFSGSSWTAGSCDGYTTATYSFVNLSGTYSFGWTFTENGLNATIKPCNGTYLPCINSGCTATSSTCTITHEPLQAPQTITATVRLTQSGLSRTVQASATFERDGSGCRTC
jgi:hypothetical protein